MITLLFLILTALVFWLLSPIFFWFDKVESPRRFEKFLRAVSVKNGCAADVKMASLDKIFFASADLIKAEIFYYYKRRKRSKHISFFIKFFAFIFGGVGLICPLFDALDPNLLNTVTQFFWEGEDVEIPKLGALGYFMLAISGALLSGDSLFGWSSGHARYVANQLNIERQLSLMIVGWSNLKTDGEKHAFINESMGKFYSIIIDETDVWQKEMKKELEDLRQKLSKQEVNKGPDSGSSLPQ